MSSKDSTTSKRGEKLSVYAGEPLALVLVGHDENRSGRINTVCDRYLAVVAAHCPKMSEDEWMAACDALNGACLRDDASIRFVWAEIADCAGLGEKWSIDQFALAQRLRAMPLAEKVALIEVVERFWSRCDLDSREALKLAGAQIEA